MLKSENARLNGWVYVDIQGRDLGSYVAEARQRVAELVDLPVGYSISWSGQYEHMQRARERLGVVAPLTLAVILSVCLGSLCASLLNAASNAINQIYDLEIDRINKPDRPLVTGELSIREGWMFTWVCYVFAIIPTWLLVVYPYNTWAEKLTAPLAYHETFFIYLAGMFFTFAYSAPELGRTKALGMWANITIAIPRGCLLKVAGWAMVAHVWHWEPWYIGLIKEPAINPTTTARR